MMSKSAADKVAQAKLDSLVDFDKPRDLFDETPTTAKPRASRLTTPTKVSPLATTKTMFRRTEVLELMHLAYLEGFMQSSEGFNGECPFKDGGQKPDELTFWDYDREARCSRLLDEWVSK